MEWVNDALQWISDFFSNLPLLLWQQVLEGLAAIIKAIPVPSFFSQAVGAFNSLPSQVVFVLDVMQFDVGLPMVLGAYALRFLIRRIPIIG